MGNLISGIQIVMGAELPDVERYDSQLKTLLLSQLGTIPGSRGFGLSYDFISKNPMEAANMLAIELEDKVEEYIPAITIDEVKLIQNDNGTISVKIFAEGREDFDDID